MIAYEYSCFDKIDPNESKKNFLRIDISKNTKSPFGIPLLFLPDDPILRLNIDEAICLYKRSIKDMAKNKPFGLAFDDDGFIQKFLSRDNDIIDIKDRIKPLIEITKEALNYTEDLYIALCAEELSPQGYDITDGIYLSKIFENLGVKNLLLSVGTRNFLPLFDRRETKKKSGGKDLLFDDPYLASAMWIKQYLKKTDIWYYKENNKNSNEQRERILKLL